MNFATWAWMIPVFTVAYAAMAPTKDAWELVDAGSALRTVRIEKVLETKYVSGQRANGHYDSVVRVLVPFDEGAQVHQSSLTSKREPRAGEETYVLFAPSSPELGFFLGSRQSLEEMTGGRADFWTIALVLISLFAVSFLALFGRWRSDPVLGLHRVREQGRLHVLPVSVTGVDVGRDERPKTSSGAGQLKPRVRLANTELGELYLFLDQI
ncbi:hypothetical protein, partial [Streptomyces zinciresistens]|uniref:hypothetical protein n=1 Tax=Streptomyces zinciresistens TaxID=1073330 RepID=UPI001AD84D09